MDDPTFRVKMEGLRIIPYVFLLIAIAGIIGGATVMTMSEFGNTMTKCYNNSFDYVEATDVCTNNTLLSSEPKGPGGNNLTDEYYVKTQGIDGLGTVAEQLPTVSIIAVMVIIISVIAGVFVYLRYFS